MCGAIGKTHDADCIKKALTNMCDRVELEGTCEMMTIDVRMVSVLVHLAALSAKNRGHRESPTDCKFCDMSF